MITGKRLADLGAGIVLSVVTLPVVVAVALVSAIAYRSWPFFVQHRVGLEGRNFRFVKVRTLPPGTGQYLDKYSVDFDEIPAIMRTFRRLHLDELPQLWHVIGGQMSLVGPRPDMAHLLSQLPEHAAATRASLRPGLTGLWQVSAHCEGLTVEAPEYDIRYVEHRSAALDLWIVAQTVRKIFTGRTILLTDVPGWAQETERPAPSLLTDTSS